MRLTEQQKQQLRSRLEGADTHCQVCGGQTWIIFDELMALKPFFGSEPVQQVSHPMVAFCCKTCYQIILFSAIGFGFIAVPGKET